MAKQQLIEKYKFIEMQRKELKKLWIDMKNAGDNPEDIKEVGRKLTELTLNQAHILIDVETIGDIEK